MCLDHECAVMFGLSKGSLTSVGAIPSERMMALNFSVDSPSNFAACGVRSILSGLAMISIMAFAN
jgi:hypothetical protein